MFKLPDEIKLGLAICVLAGVTGAQKVLLGVSVQGNKSLKERNLEFWLLVPSLRLRSFIFPKDILLS